METKTLFEILPDFLNGKRIRRDTWSKGAFIELSKYTNNTVRMLYLNDYSINLVNPDVYFSIDDIKANDWYIVDL